MQADQAEVVKGYRQLSELVPANWQTGSVEPEDGTHLHHTRTGGAKPAVLLLHGLQGAGLTWLRTARALEAAYDVVLPDLRGHGRSSRIGAGLSMDLLVADALALVKATGLARPVVVGHSLGADLAGRFAAVAPTRAAVLVDPALRDVARTLELLANAPQSMAWIKRVAAFAVRYPDPAPSAFDALGTGVFETRDCDEGVTAFLAGRPARFTGH
jgi:pimeloyl-ACP methyl ester carboxylesterase